MKGLREEGGIELGRLHVLSGFTRTKKEMHRKASQTSTEVILVDIYPIKTLASTLGVSKDDVCDVVLYRHWLVVGRKRRPTANIFASS